MKNKVLKTIAKSKESIRRLVNFKANNEELEAIKKNADLYADGNLSEWVRYASINFKPSKKDLA